MKSKRILLITLFGLVLTFNSCKDDEKPAMKFSFDGNSISLSGANLYLQYSNNAYNNHDYRQYYITDGTYNGGARYLVSSYDGATYLMEIDLAVPGGTSFTTGDYPQANWNALELNQLASYIYLESGVENEYISLESIADDAPVKVSGGFEDGEKMTLKFTGTLYYEYYNGTNWVVDEITGNFNFTGTVQDERPA